MNRTTKLSIAALLALLIGASAAQAQNTAFTFQGKLTDTGIPANAQYDLKFDLYDGSTGGTLLGTLTKDDVQVTSGIFTVSLDYGATNFNNNTGRYLEIGVRPGASTGSFTTLTPRQMLTASPYTIQAINSEKLNGIPASSYLRSDTNQTFSGGTLTATGNVGIGTTSPANKLHIHGGGLTFSDPAGFANQNRFAWSDVPTSTGVLTLDARDDANGFVRPLLAVQHTGNVGIGTTSPTDKLYIRTTNTGEGITISDGGRTLVAFLNNIVQSAAVLGTTSNDDLVFITNNTSRVHIDAAGNVRPSGDNVSDLGQSGSRWKTVWSANGTIQTSDARLKKTVTNLGYGLSQVMQLRPVTFQWKDRNDGRTHLGLIAQEVENIIPEAVERDKDPATPLGMNYTSLVPVVIKAIQEQQITLGTLKAENAALKARLAGLEKTAAKDLALARQRQSRLRGVNHVVSTGNSISGRRKAGNGLVAQN